MHQNVFSLSKISMALGSALLCCALGAQAADYQASRYQQKIESPPPTAESQSPVVSPGITAGSPAAFGASWGDAFFGIGGVSRGSDNSKMDGSAVLGAGAGDPNQYVGLEAAASIINMHTSSDGFGHDGNFALKLHRNLPWNSALAIGAQNIGRWGDARADKETYYASGTKVFLLNPNQPQNYMPLFVTLGLGDGVFRKQADQKPGKSNGKVGVFAAVAWRFLPRVGLVLDYNAEKLNTAFSFVPFEKLPITANVGVADVSGRVSKRLAAMASIGVSYHFA